VNESNAHPSPGKWQMAMAVAELYRLEITHIVNDFTAVFDPSRHLGIIRALFKIVTISGIRLHLHPNNKIAGKNIG
jgi:hypothetical protein